MMMIVVIVIMVIVLVTVQKIALSITIFTGHNRAFDVGHWRCHHRLLHPFSFYIFLLFRQYVMLIIMCQEN